MGYFSQRKKHERDYLLLNVVLITVTLLTFASFSSEGVGRFCNLLQFHFYLITFAALVYALFGKFFIHAAAALLLLIVNFGAIASAANITTNVAHDGKNNLTILYQNNVRAVEPLVVDAQKFNADIIGISLKRNPAYLPDMFGEYELVHQNDENERNFILTNKNHLRAGLIKLSPRHRASFLVFEEGDRNLVFINVDFASLRKKEEKIVFDNLAEFILAQDEPVIIAGDFGIPAWSETFKKFLAKTDLEVKNRIIMTDGKSWFNPFYIPTINLLGYRNLGLKDVDILSAHKGSYPIKFELNF